MGIKPGLFAIVAVGLIVGLTGCGTPATTGSGATTASASSRPAPSLSASPEASPSANASSAEPVVITIKAFKYTTPASVAPGAKVMVRNEDPETHTVTSAKAGAFDVNVTAGGGTANFAAPTKPGSYKFICTFHGNMTGTLVVK